MRGAAPDPALAEFLSRLAHDLRAPLAALQGYLALLAGGRTGPVTDRQREFLAACRTQQEDLHRRLEDFLVLSGHLAGARAPRTEGLDLDAWLADYAAARQERGQGDLAVAPASDTRALADPTLLRLALDHLLANGVGDAPAAGARLTTTEAGGQVVLTLAMTGAPAPGDPVLEVARRLLAGSGDVALAAPERPRSPAVRIVLGTPPDRGR